MLAYPSAPEQHPPPPGAPTGEPPGQPALRFCGACGAPRPDEAPPCPCAGRPPAATRPGRADTARAANSVAHALAFYLALLAISLLGAAIGGLIPEHDIRSLVQADFGVALAMSAVIVTAFLLRRREILPGLRPPREGPARWYLLAAMLAPLTFGLAAGITFVVGLVLNVPVAGYAEPIIEAGYGWPVVILVVCVWPAVFEELAFRGYMLSVLGRVLHAREAVIVTAMLFMFLHLQPLGFLHLLVIGLALGFLRVRSGSIYPAMILHFLHNSLVILAEYFLG